MARMAELFRMKGCMLRLMSPGGVWPKSGPGRLVLSMVLGFMFFFYFFSLFHGPPDRDYQRIKLVKVFCSCSGRGIPAFFPASMHFRIQAMFRARVRMV